MRGVSIDIGIQDGRIRSNARAVPVAAAVPEPEVAHADSGRGVGEAEGAAEAQETGEEAVIALPFCQHDRREGDTCVDCGATISRRSFVRRLFAIGAGIAVGGELIRLADPGLWTPTSGFVANLVTWDALLEEDYIKREITTATKDIEYWQNSQRHLAAHVNFYRGKGLLEELAKL